MKNKNCQGMFRRYGSGLLLIALLGCGCSKEPRPEVISGGVDIQFVLPQLEGAFGAKRQPQTRAALAAGTTVRVVAFKANPGAPVTADYATDQTYYVTAGGTLAPCTVDPVTGQFLTAAPSAKLQVIAGLYDFYTITPALPLRTDKVSVEVPHKCDFATSETPQIAVLSSDVTKAVALVELQRKCVKLTLKVQKASDYTALTALSVDANKTGVTLGWMTSSPQVCTLGGDITPTAPVAGNTLNLAPGDFTLQADNTTSTAEVCVLPKQQLTFTAAYDLTYTVSGSTVKRSLSGSVDDFAFAAKGSYQLTLTIEKSSVKVKAENWEDGGSQDNNMGQ